MKKKTEETKAELREAVKGLTQEVNECHEIMAKLIRENLRMAVQIEDYEGKES